MNEDVVPDASRPAQRGGRWHPLLVRRKAPHNQRLGGKAFGFPALRGLSAAPLALKYGLMIKLKDIVKIEDPTEYKLHLACRNEDWISPLDEYVANHKNWLGWNEWRGNRNDWTRDFVFSLIEFYPRSDAWLFGGVFKILERHKDHYVLQEVDEYRKFVGRVVLSFHRYQGMRGRAYYLEKYFDKFEVVEILPAQYSGENFPGYDNICHDFHLTVRLNEQ